MYQAPYLDWYDMLQLRETKYSPPGLLQLMPVYSPYILPQLNVIYLPSIKAVRRSAPSMGRRALEDAEKKVDSWRLFPSQVVAPARVPSLLLGRSVVLIVRIAASLISSRRWWRARTG
jgi:hypothetical protein